MLSPPIRGIGFRFCFLLSSKSSNRLFTANLFINGNVVNDIKKDIKKIHIKGNNFKEKSSNLYNYTSHDDDIIMRMFLLLIPSR